MTEPQWNACTDPRPMLKFLRGKASDRKLRLFAVGCCRRVWSMLADDRSRSGLAAAEEYADGTGNIGGFIEVREACYRAMEDASGDSESAELGHTKWHAATAVVCCTELRLDCDIVCGASEEVRQAESCFLFETIHRGVAVPYPEPEPSDGSPHASLLRCIIGNPFRPVTIGTQCLTPTVSTLARAIYEERAFDQMPILGDALEDAGCTNQDILSHCRGAREHTRGCFVLDLVLGKE